MSINRKSIHTPNIWKCVWLIAISILVSVSGQIRAAAEISSPERISVTYCTDCVPFHFSDDQGQPAGMVVELWQLWSGKTGIAIDFHPASWSDSLQRVRDGRSQVHAGLFFNEQRDRYLDYGAVLANTDTHVFLHHTLPLIERVEDLAGYRTGVLAGDYVEDHLKEHLPDDAVIPYPDYDAILRDLRAGKLKAFAADTPSGIYHLKREGLLKQFKISDNHLLYSNDWRLAVGEGKAELLEILDRGMAQISAAERNAIAKRWTSRETSTDMALITARPQIPDQTPAQTIEEESDITTQMFSAAQLAAWFAALAVVLVILLLLLKRLRGEFIDRIFERRNLSYIVLAFVTAFLAVVLLVAWFALERMDRQLRAGLADTLVTVNKSVNVSLDMWLENRTREIQHLAQDRDLLPLTQQLLALPHDANTIRNSQVLERMRALYRYHMGEINAEGFFVIAPDYISIGSMRDANIGTRNLIADQQPQLMKRAFAGETVFIPPIFSDVPLKDASGRVLERAATMFFATPLHDPSGTVAAVLTLRFDPVSEFKRMTHVGQVGASGETYAFDQQARLLTESRFEDHLAMLTEYFPGETRLLSMHIRDPGGNLLKGFQPASEHDQWPLTRMAKEALNKRDGFDISGYRDYRGIPVIGAWRWLDRLGIGLATEIDLSEALQPYHAMRMLVLGALGGVAFVALLLTALTVWLGERARSQLQLLVNERTEELRKVVQAVEQSPLCVVITDMAGNIEHVNQTFTKVTGYEAHEVIGKNPRILKGGETPLEKYESLWETILAGNVWHSEIRNRKKNGELYWGSISIAPVTDDAGTVTHFVAMTEDITEAKEVELALQEARERNNLILDSAGEGIFGLDVEGRVTFCNRAAADMLGYRPDELLGRPMHESVHYAHADGADYDVADCPMRATFQDGVTHHIDGEVLWRKDKTAFPVEYSATPISHGGNLVGAVVVFHDTTARQAAETEIKRINFLSDIALELTGSGYWHVDYSDPDYYYQSERAAKILGDPVKEDGRYHLQDEWFSHLVEANPETAENTAERYQGAIDGKYPSYDSIYAYKRPIDGKIVWVHASGKVIRDEKDKIRYMYGTYQDITAQKEAAEALANAKEAADAANQAKSAFLANMSHELRTPMNAILGYSEMLIEEAEDLEQEDFIPDLQKINKAGTHLLALINDVLDLAKIESGKMEAFAEDIDIGSLIDEVSGTAHPLMEKNNNTLSIERGQQLGSAHQDLTRLRQTLFNLLSNAAKFTHDGTITLHVNRTEQAGVDWLTFAVSDTGIGIAANKIEHVFEEFTQADDSTTRDYGGTGLGLAISRRFCQLLGGDLNAHSELGEGSTFTIRVPAILPEEHDLQPSADTATTRDMAEADLESLRKAGPGSTILVIDDDPEACEIIERYLTKDGYTVATAGSGEQGLRLAHELQPAAITLDVMMPGMDGWSVLRMLKADPVLRKIPVVMLTMIDDRTRGYSLGAVDYLTKPVDREQLNKALSRYYCAEEDICPVLLVEDDIETREIMARALEKAGWTVSEAGNGQEALDIMSGLHPHLILLDLMMPVMDGFDFLTALRAQPEWQHIPVIVITAKDLTADDRDRLSGRVEEIVEKSAYTREQLLQHVSEAVAKCNINT